MELLAQLMEGEMNGSAFQAPLKHPHTTTRESAYGALMIVKAAELIYVRVGIGWIPFLESSKPCKGMSPLVTESPTTPVIRFPA
jgi:hypothetical protein